MFSIVLAVGTSALMLLTAYLGVHVTLHPAETDRSRRIYKWSFGVCGVVACILIGVQTYYGNQTQVALETKLDKIQRNTETPPKVEVTNVVPSSPPPPIVVNAPSTPQVNLGNLQQRIAELRRDLNEFMAGINGQSALLASARKAETEEENKNQIDALRTFSALYFTHYRRRVLDVRDECWRVHVRSRSLDDLLAYDETVNSSGLRGQVLTFAESPGFVREVIRGLTELYEDVR
jgi:hypothetical protein